MKIRRRLIASTGSLYAVLLVSGAIQLCVGCDQQYSVGATVNIEPIDPLCVSMLAGGLADPGPVVAANDLENFHRSNGRGDAVRATGHGARCQDSDGNVVEYEHFGTTVGGTHIVRLSVSGGGSGVFQTILFLRRTQDRVMDDGAQRERSLLTCAGTYTLGDRDFASIRVEDGKVHIGASRYRNAEVVLQVP